MNKDYLSKVKKINDVSPSFCLAKWLQVTIDLQNGLTHSCHHPGRHEVPLKELTNNYSALHNTKFKKEQRKKMLNGERPSECEYCWNIEDLEANDISDRIIKSMDNWAYDKLDEVKNAPWDININPTYLEVMFENTCNLSCLYCVSYVSSKINNNLKKHGPFPLGVRHQGEQYVEYEALSENPYIKAFWKWLPEILNDLKVLRVTGGEPLLSQNLFTLLDYLEENPNNKLAFAVNSNLSLPSNRVEDFALRIKKLLDENKIASFEFYVSVDTIGEQAEYIRSGLNYHLFNKNMELLNKLLPDVHIVIMCTFSVLSIPRFGDFLDLVRSWKRKHRTFVLDISYLNHPQYLSPNIITEDFYGLVRSYVEKMGGTEEFSAYEVDKMRRLYHFILTDNKSEFARKNFSTFISENDKRYGFSFEETFPELLSFYEDCKAEVESE